MGLQREHKGHRIILYPAYFDSRLTRRKGRRVPKTLAVKGVKAEEILAAAKDIGLEGYVEKGSYPRVWWVSDERVVIEKSGMSKTRIIRLVAQSLKNRREARKRR